MKIQIKIQIHLASFLHIIHADVQLSRLERLESGIFGRGFRVVAAAVRRTEDSLPRHSSLRMGPGHNFSQKDSRLPDACHTCPDR